MGSVALETLRRMGKASRRPTSQGERPPLRVVSKDEDELVGRLVPLEELTELDRLVIRATFGSARTK